MFITIYDYVTIMKSPSIKQPIEDFVKQYPIEMTARGYRSSIYQFIDCHFGNVRKGKDSTADEREQYEQHAGKYLKSPDVLNDLKKFKQWMIDNQRPPHSISQNLASVRIWLEHYGYEITAKDLRELKRGRKLSRNAVTREAELSPEVIRAILNSCSDLRLRAAILLMISSGIRIGEMVKLTDDDIDFKTNTIHISDLVSKNGERRVTFFTDEAKEALEQYLNKRDDFIDRAKKMSPRLNRTYNHRDVIFPYTPEAIRKSLTTVLKRAGLYQTDRRTQRTTIHPHGFRKFFNSYLKIAGCPDDVVEALMGHEGYLSRSYRRFSDSQLREQYQKYCNVLTVSDYGFGARQELTSKVTDLEKMNFELRAQVRDLEKIIKAKDTLSAMQTTLSEDDRAAIARMVAEEMKKSAARSK